MIKYTTELKELMKKKGIYKQHRRKFCKEKGIPKEQIKKDPALFTDPPVVREGICKKLPLELNMIEDKILTVESLLVEFEA